MGLPFPRGNGSKPGETWCSRGSSTSRVRTAAARGARRTRSSPAAGAAGGSLVQDRRQVCAVRLVIQACRHQRQRLHQAQAVVQAPSEELAVPRRHDEARPAETVSRRDQRLEVQVGLRRRMPEESQRGREAPRPDRSRAPARTRGCRRRRPTPWRSGRHSRRSRA